MRFAYPRKPADAFVIACDVDGTIMLSPGEIPYNDGARLLAEQVPNQRVVDRLLQLEESGFSIRFLTGRSESLRDITTQQLEAAGFRRVAERLDMQDQWGGWKALLQHKADHLADWGVVLHIGDQDVDLEASLAVDVPYMDVEEFQRGASLDHIFCWLCGCTALQACAGGCSWATGRTCSRCAVPGKARIHDFQAVVA